MFSKSRYLAALVLLFFGLYSCQSAKSKSDSSDKKGKAISYIEGVVVKPALLDRSISVSGTLKPFEETVLMTEVAGRVIEINLPEGKFVKSGTLLVKLFDDDLKAQLHKAETQLEIAQKTEQRMAELLKISGVSQSEYDQSLLQVHSIKNDIEVLKVQIRKTEVMAPFDGVIGLRNISLGAQVTPGTPLATIRIIDKLKLDFSVPEKYSQDVVQGKKIRFSVQGDDKTFDAVVMATEEGISASTRNLNARAVVNVNGEHLVPGSFAKVDLILGDNRAALMVPTQAIIPQERNKRVIVCRNGKAEFAVIKTGIRQASAVEVIEGLNPGDTVVTTGLMFIRPGAELKFSKITN